MVVFDYSNQFLRLFAKEFWQQLLGSMQDVYFSHLFQSPCHCGSILPENTHKYSLHIIYYP